MVVSTTDYEIRLMTIFTLMTTLYNPSTWCTDIGIIHFIKVQGKDEHSYFLKTAKGYVYPNRFS